MKHYPVHVDGFPEPSERFAEEADDYHHFFQIVCTCHGRSFRPFISNKKSVKAECAACKNSIMIYDLARYPAATKLRGHEEFRPAVGEPVAPGAIYVMYEYGERDADEPFDRNDITWCQVWWENLPGKLLKVLDDETA